MSVSVPRTMCANTSQPSHMMRGLASSLEPYSKHTVHRSESWALYGLLVGLLLDRAQDSSRSPDARGACVCAHPKTWLRSGAVPNSHKALRLDGPQRHWKIDRPMPPDRNPPPTTPTDTMFTAIRFMRKAATWWRAEGGVPSDSSLGLYE